MRLESLRGNLLAKYLLIAALPLAVLLFTPVSNYVVLLLGERVLLETLPFDPRDILRGDYVRLEYEIDTIDADLVPAEFDEDADEYAYVSLSVDGRGVGRVLGVSRWRPGQGPYLKARLNSYWKRYDADYNLGVYYVPEGTGRALEDAIRDKRVLADVRILRGRGVIKTLEIAD